MSYARYHDQLAEVMSEYPGQVLTSKRIRQLFQVAYPDLDTGWLSPSDHCLEHKPKGACWCAGTGDAIFTRPRRNTYIVLSQSISSSDSPPKHRSLLEEEPLPSESQTAGDSQIAQAILEFGNHVDPRELFPVLVPEAADFVLGDPYAFALAICLDRGTKADIIWTIPYYIKQDLGHLVPRRIVKLSIPELQALFHRLPNKPRYVNDAPRTTQELSTMVVYQFDGDAARIWEGKSAREVKRTFRNIYGVGEQISNMAILLIEKGFGERFSDLDRPTMDIKADVHTRRVLYRLGAAPSQAEQDTINTARRLHPSYPGELDAPLWIVGRNWCHYSRPHCSRCPLTNVCQKVNV